MELILRMLVNFLAAIQLYCMNSNMAAQINHKGARAQQKGAFLWRNLCVFAALRQYSGIIF
jgi:hypothetical protein